VHFNRLAKALKIHNRLEKEFGEHVAEKQGWHWALTSSAVEAWNGSEKE
jgi:hypothetical protein